MWSDQNLEAVVTDFDTRCSLQYICIWCWVSWHSQYRDLGFWSNQILLRVGEVKWTLHLSNSSLWLSLSMFMQRVCSDDILSAVKISAHKKMSRIVVAACCVYFFLHTISFRQVVSRWLGLSYALCHSRSWSCSFDGTFILYDTHASIVRYLGS